jgi:ABC-type sugar transport system ATPase subunit
MPLSAASARAVSKHFGATRALDNVHFDVLAGEVHTLVGENGAGKSTLVRVLGGVHRPDSGDRDPRTGLPLSTARAMPSRPG